MNKPENRKIEYGIIVFLAVALYLLLMWMLTGNGPLKHNPYNSYALQAESWTQGRLELKENYSYLELAEYNGKYYVSFPPFPSYILLPFAFLFGHDTPDYLILWLIDFMTIGYLYLLSQKFIKDKGLCALTSLFVMLGTNVTFNMLNPWVWFFAQTLCFLLAVMAIYYALEGKGGLSLGLWACSVGCRPMQALYLPILLYILISGEIKLIKQEEVEASFEDNETGQTEENKEADEEKPTVRASERGFLQTFVIILKKRILWAIPPFVIALSYMILNFLRFGNITEFGHNYLPEFVEAEHGQFDIFYLKDNFRMLLNLPSFDAEGRMVIDHFGNINFMLVSPFVLFAIAMIVIDIFMRDYKVAIFNGSIFLLSALYLVITMMHKTMGGWHFGNRYTNDILPWLFLTTILGLRICPKAGKYQIPLFIFGLCLNAVGLVVVYNGMYIG